ncbi:MAG: FAD:protein FMN transferase, partial [Candidatus Eutrophobiaceae bacterium]
SGYSIHIQADAEARPRLAAMTDTLLESINARMSTYIPDSELMRLNRAPAHKDLPISKELFTVLATALQISAMTEGAFDITAGGLVELWGFGAAGQKRSWPTNAEVATALEQTGYHLIELDAAKRSVRKKHMGVFIDLSGIAKGYAVDQVAELFLAKGYENFSVEIGGELRAQGRNPQGEVWNVGIERPSARNGKPAPLQVARILPLRNAGLASSGDYRNYARIGDALHSHIIDPATGRPVRHKLAAATVIHQQAMVADALATAMLVMGTEKALAFANQQNLGALLIERNEDGLRIRQSKCLPLCVDQHIEAITP